jgi:nucleoside-diphosphate-sugar epimerase
MKVFVAGGTGAIGRFLVPRLIDNGHDVVALVRAPEKAPILEAIGAKSVVADPLDSHALSAVIKNAEPEVIIHQLTALSHASGNFKKFDEEFWLTNRFRTEVTDTILGAAPSAGARRVIVQSFCGWPFARVGGPIKTEEDPLDSDPPASFTKTLQAIRYLEGRVRRSTDLEVLALRYGFFYGPGTGFENDGPVIDLIRRRRLPIIGNGAGVWSFVHIEDAATATVTAVSRGAAGIYNIVDDDPAPVSTWLPLLAEILQAKAPRKLPAWLGKLMVGEGGVSMVTKIRGGSNQKAKRELGWQPARSSWRQGFAEVFG